MATIELKFTHEGVSLSVYDGDVLLDETWFTWAEVEDNKSDGDVDSVIEI